MKVRAQFYAQLRELVGNHELEVELRQDATVSELLEKSMRKNLRFAGTIKAF